MEMTTTIHTHNTADGYRTQQRGNVTAVVSPNFPPHPDGDRIAIQVRWGSTLRWTEIDPGDDIAATVHALVDGARWNIPGEPAVQPSQVSFSFCDQRTGVMCPTDPDIDTWTALADKVAATVHARN